MMSKKSRKRVYVGILLTALVITVCSIYKVYRVSSEYNKQSYVEIEREEIEDSKHDNVDNNKRQADKVIKEINVSENNSQLQLDKIYSKEEDNDIIDRDVVEILITYVVGVMLLILVGIYVVKKGI